MYNLLHETNQRVSTCQATIKSINVYTHHQHQHAHTQLTSCLTPAPVRTESCQRHTGDTTCWPSESLNLTHHHPALCYSIPGLNVSFCSRTQHTTSLLDTSHSSGLSLQSFARRGVLRKREGIPPEETGSCGSGSTGAPQMRRVLNRKGQQVRSKNGRED